MLPLPTIKSKDSIFYITLPSDGKKIPFRRMKVSEEKILLLAKQAADSTEIHSAILQVTALCCEDKGLDIGSLPIFDLEYAYLKIRGQSVSNIMTVTYSDLEDNKDYVVNINIEDVKVQGLKKPEEFKIMFDVSNGIQMKYPAATLYNDKGFLEQGKDAYQRLMIKCIDKIFTVDDVFLASDYTEEELIKWLDDLELVNFNLIDKFVSSLPVISYEAKYKNTMGTERSISLSTLNDFFMLV